jgi:hypothetical protein
MDPKNLSLEQSQLCLSPVPNRLLSPFSLASKELAKIDGIGPAL